MTNRLIDLEEAKRLARVTMTERGEDFVYQPPNEGEQTCVYVHDGKPSCWIGHIVWQLDPTLLDLIEERDLNSTTAFALLDLIGSMDDQPDFETEAIEFLGHLQEWQDGESPYGQAYRAAERITAGLGPDDEEVES